MICTAHRTNGQPCKSHAIQGATVCRKHGGGAPQVREAARLRLAAMVDPALGVLLHAMKQKTKQLPSAITAAKDVFDRAGLKETDKLEITGTLRISDVLRARRQKREVTE